MGVADIALPLAARPGRTFAERHRRPRRPRQGAHPRLEPHRLCLTEHID